MFWKLFQVVAALAALGMLFMRVQEVMIPDTDARRRQLQKFWKTGRGLAVYCILGLDCGVALFHFLHVILSDKPLTPQTALNAALSFSVLFATAFLIALVMMLDYIRFVYQCVRDVDRVHTDAIERLCDVQTGTLRIVAGVPEESDSTEKPK